MYEQVSQPNFFRIDSSSDTRLTISEKASTSAQSVKQIALLLWSSHLQTGSAATVVRVQTRSDARSIRHAPATYKVHASLVSAR